MEDKPTTAEAAGLEITTAERELVNCEMGKITKSRLKILVRKSKPSNATQVVGLTKTKVMSQRTQLNWSI